MWTPTFQAARSGGMNHAVTIFGRLLLSVMCFKNTVISFSRIELKLKQKYGCSCSRGEESLKVTRAGSE